MFSKKEIYERKREWAAKRAAENREIETLTEEQHDLLEELCTFRHDLHTNWESAFNPYSAEYKKYEEAISEYSVGMSGEELPCRIENAFGRMPFRPIDYPTYADWDECGYETVEEAKEEAFSMFERVNTQIEEFLASVDAEHGTSYCPSGATRI